MVTKEELIQQLEAIEEQDVEVLGRVIAAWQRSRKSPMAYIEELMQFQTFGFDQERQAYLHQMQITDELRNRIHTLHGGIIATFVDISVGATVLAELGTTSTVVTLDLSVHYLVPGKQGILTCVTEIVKKGNTILVVEAKIYDEQEKLIATASSTFYRVK